MCSSVIQTITTFAFFAVSLQLAATSFVLTPRDIIGNGFGASYYSFSTASKASSPPWIQSSQWYVIISCQQVLAVSDFAYQPLGNTVKCLTAASNSDAVVVTIQPCREPASQKWTFGGGVVEVFGRKWLGVPEGRLVDGTKLQIWTCSTNNANQK